MDFTENAIKSSKLLTEQSSSTEVFHYNLQLAFKMFPYFTNTELLIYI